MASAQPRHSGESREQNRRQKLWGWFKDVFIPLNLFTGLLVVVAGLQTCILYNTDHTLNDTLRTNKLSQRAFVFPSLSLSYLSPDFINPRAINFIFDISNNGNTATKGFRFYLKCIPSVEDLDEPWAQIIQGRGKAEQGAAVIGPKSKTNAGCSFPIDQFENMTAKKLFGFIVLDIAYEDGMNIGVGRRTQMSVRLTDPSLTPSRVENGIQIPAVAATILQNWGAHNCADDECPK